MAALLLGGCGDDDDADAGITVTDAWARASAPDAPSAAFYLEISNETDDDDTLTDGSTEVCDVIEIHTMEMDGDVMTMSPAGEAERRIAAGGELVLEPGGLHVMCMGLREPLVEGEDVDLQLGFASGESIDVAVDVRAP